MSVEERVAKRVPTLKENKKGEFMDIFSLSDLSKHLRLAAVVGGVGYAGYNQCLDDEDYEGETNVYKRNN